MFFGDTSHLSTKIPEVIFSKPVIDALAEEGYHDLYVERPPLSRPKMDALLRQQISPEEYVLVSRPQYSSEDHIPPAIREAHDYILAKELGYAASRGVTIHPSDSGNGCFKDAVMQKRYIFLSQEKERLWMNFLLKNRDYFAHPEILIDNLIVRHGPRYVQKNIDLECLRPHHQPLLSPWGIIYQFWNLDNEKAFLELSKIEQRMQTVLSGNIPQLIKNRQKQDVVLCRDFNRQSKGGKFAVFYGCAHIRNSNGGFLTALLPEDVEIFHLFESMREVPYKQQTFQVAPETQKNMWNEHVRPDDTVLVLESRQIIPAAHFSYNPIKGALEFNPPLPP